MKKRKAKAKRRRQVRNSRALIRKPGIYEGMSLQDYINDPCPTPSCNSHLALMLLERSPMHAFYHHPRLNSYLGPIKPTRGMERGSCAHDILFGRSMNLKIIEAPDYRRKGNQAQRAKAMLDGKIPILREEYKLCRLLAERASKLLIEEFGAEPYLDEAVIAWKEGELWCRARLDRLYQSLQKFIDYKTTALSAEPVTSALRMYKSNYHFQLAFYERGLDALDPDGFGRRRCGLLFQEVEAPFGQSIVGPDPHSMESARRRVHIAIRKWRKCALTNVWPGYKRGMHFAMMPIWMEREHMAFEEEHSADLDDYEGRLPYDPPKLYAPS
jgi:hypothetical protein